MIIKGNGVCIINVTKVRKHMLILLVNSSSIWNADVILELQWPSWISILEMKPHLEAAGKTRKDLGT